MNVAGDKVVARVLPLSYDFKGRTAWGVDFSGKCYDFFNTYTPLTFFQCYRCEVVEAFPRHFNEPEAELSEQVVCRKCVEQLEKTQGRKLQVVPFPEDATVFIRNAWAECRACTALVTIKDLDKHMINHKPPVDIGL